MDLHELERRIDSLDLKQKDIADFLGITPDKVSKVFAGKRQWSGQELIKLTSWLEELAKHDNISLRPELPSASNSRDYVSIEILPSYAGMGGGGTGEGDTEIGLVPRSLIEQELRATPTDFLMIDVRGDSMMPDFQHGDQILIDKRDTNPIQPGSFALWDGDGYVVKLVERMPQKPGWYRIFSSNGRYAAYEVDAEQIKIMGRPVWFARRL
ncbi:S24 family peptidase [Parasphingorhabdus sp.]|uniref:S24 family peptidase n=1 Tax=Parasphingorhabdus sp. TaxID=2709688 RepID=UPI003A931936